MQETPYLIEGGIFNDDRGILSYVNGFAFDEVKRFYVINHDNTEVVRAWQAHKIEQKWFFVTSGCFKVIIVKIKDWDYPEINTEYEEFILEAVKPQLLYIPAGYANGFQAMKKNTQMIVFSNLTLKAAATDNFKFDRNLWYNWKK